MAARKRRAAFAARQRRGPVVQRAAEFHDVARPRAMPMIFEDRVDDEPRTERDAEQ
jgi:hypothetical protein